MDLALSECGDKKKVFLFFVYTILHVLGGTINSKLFFFNIHIIKTRVVLEGKKNS